LNSTNVNHRSFLVMENMNFFIGLPSVDNNVNINVIHSLLDQLHFIVQFIYSPCDFGNVIDARWVSKAFDFSLLDY
jgi:hypothetical protein